MHCYSCDGEELAPVMLDTGLPARECAACGGVHLDLLAYRAWQDARGEAQAPRAGHGGSLVKADDNRKALVCQRCGCLMLKYRIATELENSVDVCSSCEDVWLDGGEWELLKNMDLAANLTEIMSQPWQTRVRAETAQRSEEARMRELLGEADFARLGQIERWIGKQAERDEMLRWLQQRLQR